MGVRQTGIEMQLDIEKHAKSTVIRYGDSRLDAAIAVQFKERFRELTDGDEGRVVLDLTSVGFMDSSGLGALVAIYKHLGQDRIFDLAGLTPPVARVLTLTRMDSVFNIFADTDAALADDRTGNATIAAG